MEDDSAQREHPEITGNEGAVKSIHALDSVRQGPNYEAYRDPIMYFLVAVYDQKDLRPMIFRTLATALASPTKHLYRRVKGPVSAFVYAAYKIGWQVSQDLPGISTRVGMFFNFRLHSPPTLGHYIYSDIRYLLWSELCSRNDSLAPLNGLPWLDPIQQLLKAKDKPDWGAKHMGILGNICAQGVVTQDRLFAMGYAQSDACTCMQPDSIHHLVWECQYTRAFRDQYELGEPILAFKADQPPPPPLALCPVF